MHQVSTLIMDTLLPQAYLLALTGLLVIVAVLVGRQLLKVRKDEAELIQLEKVGANTSKDAAELYELASVQLRKGYTLKQRLIYVKH